MRWGSWIGLGVATLALGCSSIALPDGTGGSGVGGTIAGVGGMIAGVGGAQIGIGGAGTGGAGVGGAGDLQGSCIPGQTNPDFAPGGACAPDCQSVSCGRICTQDCCVACGIDLSGSKVCLCPAPGTPFITCSCIQPVTIPPGLQGGPCSPQGFSTPTVPVGATMPSLRGLPCKVTSPLTVCFTADSTASSERGCICESDGVMHCGSVNHWFINSGVQTSWMP